MTEHKEGTTMPLTLTPYLGVEITLDEATGVYRAAPVIDGEQHDWQEESLSALREHIAQAKRLAVPALLVGDGRLGTKVEEVLVIAYDGNGMVLVQPHEQHPRWVLTAALRKPHARRQAHLRALHANLVALQAAYQQQLATLERLTDDELFAIREQA